MLQLRIGESSDFSRFHVENGDIVVTWSSLLETAQRLHRDYLDVVKARAPHDDPRIVALNAIDDTNDDSAYAADEAGDDVEPTDD